MSLFAFFLFLNASSLLSYDQTFKSLMGNHNLLICITVPTLLYLTQSLSEVKEKVEGGYRMEAPEDCPPGVYSLMRICWELEPRKRPTFHKVREKLEQEMGKHHSDSGAKHGDGIRSRSGC